jgi:hypothetical protein
MTEFNARTGGMIDTADSFRGAIKLQEAGLNANKEEIAAIGVAAAEMNRRLGGGPEGATTEFNKLTKAIIQGRESALLPYGIELSQTADKAAASREAMAALEAKFSGVSVEAETAKERMFAFNNSLGTIAAAEFNGFLDAMNGLLFDQNGIMDGLTDSMSEYEADIIATKGAITEWSFTQEGFLNRVGRWGAWLKGDTDRLRLMNNQYQNQVGLLTRIAELQDAAAGAKDRETKRREIVEMVADFRGAEGRDKKLLAQRVMAKLGGKLDSEMSAGERKALADAKKVSRARDGGGGRSPVDTSVQFSLEETERGDVVRQRVEERLARERGDIGTSAFVSTIDPLNQELAGLGRGQGRGRAQAAAQADMQRRQEHLAAIAELERESAKERAEIEKELAEKRLELQQESMGATANILGATSKLVGENSEEAFNASKALAFSQNVVGTIQGAQSAFQAAQRLGPVAGPIVGAINAAAVTTAGVAAGRQILSTSFKSKTQAKNTTKQSSFPSGGSGVGGGDNNDTFNIAVVLNGATIQQDSIRQNQMEKQAGNPHFVM